jgi:2-polyprenyl-3-methyl-5-hydroxy-6-metoxy-1,4-benzoquinol methylase
LQINDQKQLNQLHKHFYDTNSSSWDASRQGFWPGWEQAWRIMKPELVKFGTNNFSVLDLASGNGRFAQFLANKSLNTDFNQFIYLGVDISLELLKIAQKNINYQENSKIEFKQADISDFLLMDKGRYNLISMFGITHHLLKSNLAQIMSQLTARLQDNGLVCLTYWQPESTKILNNAEQISEDEYILNWGPDKSSETKRYVRLYTKEEKLDLINVSALKLIAEFEADGRNGKLNHYQILQKK